MIWLEVLATLLRELVRAFIVPVRLLCYLPARHHWRRIARGVLEDVARGKPVDQEQALSAFFAKARPPRGERPHLFLSAGEASGEGHAERLLHELGDTVRCTGFGGARMQQAGADLRFGLSEHAVMGIFGVLQQLPLILRAVATYLRLLRDDRPDLVVLVDFPGLHLVMAKAAKRRGIPVLHYVAPQYWAWGPWRMRRYRRAVDATLTILPFETAFFQRFDIPAAYVGHPLLDELQTTPPPTERDADTLVLLPGSRRHDIRRNLPGMLRTADALAQDHPNLRVVVPHENPRRAELLRELLDAANAAHVEPHIGPLAPWLERARLVVAKSGTGSLAACLRGAPTVVVYQLSGFLSALGYHNILSVPWIAAANLIVGREVVPEHCFTGNDGWRTVQQSVRDLWPDGEQRDKMLAGLDDVRSRLGDGGASARTATIIQRFFATPSNPKPEA